MNAPQSEANPKILTRKEAAGLLRVGLGTLDKILDQKAIPFVKIGRAIRIDRADVRKFLETRKSQN